MNNNTKGVIFFDIDDTLYNSSAFFEKSRKTSLEAMIEAGLSVEIEELYSRLIEIYEKDKNSQTHYNQLLSSLNVPSWKADRYIAIATYEYQKFKLEQFSEFRIPLAKPVLTALKKNDFILGIISSGIGPKQHDKLYRLNLTSFFPTTDTYISHNSSNEKTFSKTDSDFYAGTRRNYEDFYQTNNIWMVGDREKCDIIPAREGGMKTLRVGTGKYCEDFSNSKADICLNSISEIESELFLK